MRPWLWYFWIYSFLGWLVELAFAAASRSEDRRRRCLLFLPLCPVYGLGMLAALALPPMGRLGLTVSGGLAATAVEYAYHWAGERFLGVRFWDYAQVPGNLRGRVCLPFSLAWGLLVWAAVTFVQPAAAALAAAVPDAATYVCLLLFTGDLVCSLWFLRVTGDLRGMRAAVFPPD
ncbi:putative ABC transporter permease [Oscillibacter sp.]|uniref:putative ABC transporter permease n=1 Tax=Oscillibacter sp. TaxID=1945593 RepID=UPI002D7F811E|nr:putative ABC transporter permease [Oscillibacter sp.]